LELRLKRYAPFFILPMLWFILAFAALDRGNAATPPGSYQFIPYALAASNQADYGRSAFTGALAPIESDIILEALRDQMALDARKPTPTVSGVISSAASPDTEPSDDGPLAPTPTEERKGRGQGNGGLGNGNGKGNKKN